MQVIEGTQLEGIPALGDVFIMFFLKYFLSQEITVVSDASCWFLTICWVIFICLDVVVVFRWFSFI